MISSLLSCAHTKSERPEWGNVCFWCAWGYPFQDSRGKIRTMTSDSDGFLVGMAPLGCFFSTAMFFLRMRAPNPRGVGDSKLEIKFACPNGYFPGRLVPVTDRY